jgi:hypothetical protein
LKRWIADNNTIIININEGNMKKDPKDHDKSITIIVNTREKEWDKKKISYQEVVILAYGEYSDNPLISYTVTYSNGPKQNPEGSMVKNGKDVHIHDGMIFNVTKTDKS